MAHIAIFVGALEIISGGNLGVSGTAILSSQNPNDPPVVWSIATPWTQSTLELNTAIVTAAIAAALTAGLPAVGAADTKRLFAAAV